MLPWCPFQHLLLVVLNVHFAAPLSFDAFGVVGERKYTMGKVAVISDVQRQVYNVAKAMHTNFACSKYRPQVKVKRVLCTLVGA